MSIRGQGHSLIFAKGHSDFKIKFFSQKLLGHLKPKSEAYERMRMKIYTNELHHMTKIAAMPIKTFQKSVFLEPVHR